MTTIDSSESRCIDNPARAASGVRSCCCAVFAGLLAMTVHAPAVAQAEQISVTRTITSMMTYGDQAVIRFTPAATGHGCPGPAATTSVVIVWSGNPSARALLAQAIFAQSTGRLVGFGVNGCNAATGPGSGIPIAYRIDVKS